ncbi:type IV pilus assembly protein PilV [Acidovorax sp. 99]|uniref:type IV pilus modification protein PilV n=1 Tax=Acidovorax sp. 99 TaxID=2135634 RepID=UPI000D5D23B8|nr:type IV pilus modification protein PilV [Acidovorax sp. 99]PVY89775.1 type IV pilus assembly protein PilV [Acidovorax sp. 99]
MLQLKAAQFLKTQRGFSLLEVLVAIVVMTLGILGILGVQMRTLTDTQAGVRRGQAIRFIEDLGERLESSPDALNNLVNYKVALADALPTDTSECCTSAACNPTDLAACDLRQWRLRVDRTLPGAKTAIFIPQGAPRQLGVMIGWNENRYNQNGQSFSSSDLTALTAPLAVSGIDSAGTAISCPSGLICHIQYLQPTQRCTPEGGTLYCPN